MISYIKLSFIRVYDGIRYTSLLGLEKYNAIYNRIEYLIMKNIFIRIKSVKIDLEDFNYILL